MAAEAAPATGRGRRSGNPGGTNAVRVPMAILCPGCGREYDVTLFQFGRTLHCTCGSRVGGDLPGSAGRSPSGAPPRFLADGMLGRLARWLRLLGIDTAHEPDADDASLVRRALEEERTLLSRDRRLPVEWRIPDVLILESDGLDAQLREVARQVDLRRWSRPLTRCPRCNGPLAAVEPAGLDAEIPSRVPRLGNRFRRCTGCGKLYWEGSHTRRIRRRLAQILEA